MNVFSWLLCSLQQHCTQVSKNYEKGYTETYLKDRSPSVSLVPKQESQEFMAQLKGRLKLKCLTRRCQEQYQRNIDWDRTPV